MGNKDEFNQFCEEKLMPLVNSATAEIRDGKLADGKAKFAEAQKLLDDYEGREYEMQVLGFEVIVLASHDANTGIKQSDAAAFMVEQEKKGIRLLTNQELDAILQNDRLREKYYPVSPFLTGTHVDLDGAKCVVKENGDERGCVAPTKDGWYEQDEQGLPFGKPLTDKIKEARYLNRLKKFSGLVARNYNCYDRQGVVLFDDPYLRFGVLGKRIVKSESKE